MYEMEKSNFLVIIWYLFMFSIGALISQLFFILFIEPQLSIVKITDMEFYYSIWYAIFVLSLFIVFISKVIYTKLFIFFTKIRFKNKYNPIPKGYSNYYDKSRNVIVSNSGIGRTIFYPDGSIEKEFNVKEKK